MPQFPIYQVDAFADGPFAGNPAAVCPLEEWLPDGVMLGIAAENNLSETAFFIERDNGYFDLRWFTPSVEVDLCGHATLASGHVILNVLSPAADSVKFHTRSGELRVDRREDGLLALDIPARRSIGVADRSQVDLIADLLGARPDAVMDVGLPLAVFANEQDVTAVDPDPKQMLESGVHWLSVTAPADDQQTDFVSRFFAPGSGIAEDPVTGSAHGWLVPYWSERLGKRSLTARQVSKRGGWLWCEDKGDRVSVAGKVRDYMAGQIAIE